VGTTTGYTLDTLGYDIHNSSRFHELGLDNTVTVGTDLFADTVESTGSNTVPDAGYRLTASGDRQAYGAFGEWDAKYEQWLEVIGGLRFDGYHMASDDYDGGGSRLSPKITIGLTPFKGLTFYGTYAEGYRAPALNEAFAVGEHPGELFQFLPNPALQPEIGHTLEAGVNLSHNDLFQKGDSLRIKADVFNNQVTDFIDGVEIDDPAQCSFVGAFGPLCYQYQNIASARIRGVEAEATYDAGKWFVETSASVQDGIDTTTGDKLTTVLPASVAMTVGMRFLDNKLTVAPNWRYVASGAFEGCDDQTASCPAFNLFGLSIAYQPNENTTASLVFDNIFNAEYTPYLGINPGEGFNIKASLKVKLAAN
jgi:hemoglobin/transferrin/lactoferrin receptor protein